MTGPPWSISRATWSHLVAELGRRGAGERESGAFLLGQDNHISSVAYYDDLAPGSLDRGIIVFPSSGFGPLWDRCAAERCRVVGDVHTHEYGAHQSLIDSHNPMIGTPGHLALIVPFFALRSVQTNRLGIYEYLGSHRWRDHSGPRAFSTFLIKDLS